MKVCVGSGKPPYEQAVYNLRGNWEQVAVRQGQSLWVVGFHCSACKRQMPAEVFGDRHLKTARHYDQDNLAGAALSIVENPDIQSISPASNYKGQMI